MMIDMHHHLIWGVDDGAESFAGTEKMLRDAVDNDVEAIITTPHITPGQKMFPYEDYAAHLEETRAWIREQGIGIRLYTGSEVLYTQHTPRLLMEGKVPTLADTQYVLVEFSPDDPYEYLLKAGDGIASAGYIPVIAHVERYDCLKKPDQVRQLRRQCNALIQVNAGTVVRKHKFFRERYLRKLFTEHLVDFISTDSHDLPGRSNKFKAAYEALAAEYGAYYARALTHDNAQRILGESGL